MRLFIAEKSSVAEAIAGDPDREGQLLIDEALAHFNNTRPVQRFWVSGQQVEARLQQGRE